MRADRLLTILLMIQHSKKQTTRQLAQALEVSERTIIRDMEALSTAGVPVYAERGPAGGWMLSGDYRTNLTGMSPQELISLFVMPQPDVLEDLGMKHNYQLAYQKLLAGTPAAIRDSAQNVRQKLHMDGAGWHQSIEQTPLLPTIQEAVWEDRVLKISYERGPDLVERHIHPLGLVAKRNVWYVVAETEGEGSLRTYRISRLKQAVMLDNTFTRPSDFSLESYWEQSLREFKSNLPRYPARICATAEAIAALRRRPYVTLLHTAQDQTKTGWITADVEFQTLESAREIVLSFGSELLVYEPAELRKEVYAAANAIVQLYRSTTP